MCCSLPAGPKQRETPTAAAASSPKHLVRAGMNGGRAGQGENGRRLQQAEPTWKHLHKGASCLDMGCGVPPAVLSLGPNLLWSTEISSLLHQNPLGMLWDGSWRCSHFRVIRASLPSGPQNRRRSFCLARGNRSGCVLTKSRSYLQPSPPSPRDRSNLPERARARKPASSRVKARLEPEVLCQHGGREAGDS